MDLVGGFTGYPGPPTSPETPGAPPSWARPIPSLGKRSAFGWSAAGWSDSRIRRLRQVVTAAGVVSYSRQLKLCETSELLDMGVLVPEFRHDLFISYWRGDER